MTPRSLRNIHTTRNTVGTHFHAQHGTKTILVFLPADGESSWLLFPSSVSLLSGSTVQPENTFIHLHPQGDWSGLRKPKKNKHQNQSKLPPAFLLLSQSQVI